MEIVTIKKRVNGTMLNKDPDIFGDKFESLLEKLDKCCESKFTFLFFHNIKDDVVRIRLYEQNKVIQADIFIDMKPFNEDPTDEIVGITACMIEVISKQINRKE